MSTLYITIDKMLAKYEDPSYSEGIDVIIYV